MSDVNVKFGAEDDGLSSALKKTQTGLKDIDKKATETNEKVSVSFKSMAAAAAGVAVGIGVLKAGFAAISGTAAAFGEALDMGGRLSDLSARTGESAGKMLLLERAFENAGSSADKVGPTINKLQKFISDASDAGSAQAETLGLLGLSYDELKAKTPTEQLRAMADAIAAVDDNTERGAKAISSFGKNGGELLPFLRDFKGSLEEAKVELGGMVRIMDEKSAVFDTVSDKLNVVKGKLTEFAAGILSQTVPALELFVTTLSRIDAASIGESFAKAFVGGQAAMEGFSASLAAMKISEFKLSFEIAWASIVLQAAQSANSIYAHMKAAFSASAEFLTVALGPGSGVWTILNEAADIIGKKMSVGIGKGLLLVLEPLKYALPGVITAAGQAIKDLESSIDVSSSKMKNSLEQIPGDFILAAEESKKSFESALASASKLVETAGLELDLKNKMTELTTKQTEASSAQAQAALESLQNQQNFSEYQITIGEARTTNLERVKELENEITNAKAQGNEALVKELESQKAYAEQLVRSLAEGKTLLEASAQAANAYANSLKQAAGSAENIRNENEKIRTLGDEIVEAQKRANEPAQKQGDIIKENKKTLGELRDLFPEMGNDLEKLSQRDLAEVLGIDVTSKETKELAEEIKEKLGDLNLKPLHESLNVESTTEEILKAFKEIEKHDIEVGLDADQSVKDLRTAIEKDPYKIELVPKTKSGSDEDPSRTMEYIKTAVEAIKELVAKIEPKLPTVALAH